MKFFQSSSSTETRSSSDSTRMSESRSSHANYYILPHENDFAAYKEIEIQRAKWKKFMQSRGYSFSETWLWQNWRNHIESSNLIQKKFMQMFNSKVKAQKKLKSLMRGGVPPELRGAVWYACSGAEDKKKSAPSEDQYRMLLLRTSEIENTPVAHDIEKDLNRTFPEFMEKDYYENIINSLRRVLLAFAIRNTSIGYCQSMNYICGLLLFHMNEEHSFWVLSALIEDILPPNYYDRDLIGNNLYITIISTLIMKNNYYNYFKKNVICSH